MNIKNILFRKSTNELVQEIHDSFNLEGDRLLKEAKELLATETNIENGKRLQKLGFTLTKEAVEAKEVTETREKKRSLAQKIEHFQAEYPLQRFINEDGVKRICNKYGLVMGRVAIYKGTVPEKNISEIENFKIKEGDVFYHRIVTLLSYYSFINTISFTTEIRKEQYQNREPGYKIPDSFTSFYTNENDYQICAPAKDFDLTNSEIKGHFIVAKVPDPVVLYPVRGGYLIISAWGKEASDSEVANSKMN